MSYNDLYRFEMRLCVFVGVVLSTILLVLVVNKYGLRTDEKKIKPVEQRDDLNRVIINCNKYNGYWRALALQLVVRLVSAE